MTGPVRRRDQRPDPPADLHQRDLPLRRLAPREPLYRIHRTRRDPVFFGPAGHEPQSRFDDPAGLFKVCYLGLQPEASFVETLLRAPGKRVLSLDDLRAWSLADLHLSRPVDIVQLEGPHLATLGATAEVVSTRDYSLPGAWSRSLFEHPARPDGILYPCRHDPSVHGLALFDRARDAIRLFHTRPLDAEGEWFGRLADRYRLGLTL